MMTNQSVSHYRVLDKLGEGATAVVYRAEDLALGRTVALKFLASECSTDYGRIARFQHEARTVASLNHPNICTIYEIGEEEGRHYISMELLDGQPLSRIVGARPVATYQLIELAIQIADGLDAAHAQGIVHRDVKPANIFVTCRDQVKLLDFGLAVLVPRTAGRQAPSMPQLGLSGGTIPYMSPEQVHGENLDARTDVFSLGVVVYEMATGRRPFIGGAAREMMDAIVNQTPVPVREINPTVSPDLERIIDRALEKNPKLRYQTASDLRADLQRLKRDLDSASVRPHGRTASTTQPPRLGSPRRAAVLIGSIATSAALILAIVAVKNRFAASSLEGSSAAQTVGSDVFLAPKALMAAAAPVQQPSRPLVAARALPAPETSITKSPSRPLQNDDESTRDRFGADLSVARQKIDLKLYDQALETLRRVADGGSANQAIEAYFLMASIHDIRGKPDDAMSTYLETANRHPDDGRAPEAIYRMAESMLKSKHQHRDVEARRMLTQVVDRYPGSSWAPLALMARAKIEQRENLYERDDRLGTAVPSALVTYRHVADRYDSSSSAALAAWNLGQTYLAVKRFDLAVATFVSLGAHDSEHRDAAWFAAGELYEKRLKDPAQAKSAYAQVRPSSPRYREAQKRLRR